MGALSASDHPAEAPGHDEVAALGSAGVPTGFGYMSYREFNDREGRLWEVWEVRPAVIERRQADDRRRQPRDFSDRRAAELQFRLLGGLRDGWLTFQCGIERRRLTPIPEGWTSLPDDTLRALSTRATPVNRAGLSSRVTGFGLTPKDNNPVPDKSDDDSA